MRVLMLNRADALVHRGGDTVQMLRTQAELEKLGLQVDISTEPTPALKGYDLAHIFNIQSADHSLQQLKAAKQRGLPVALSTIYWDLRALDRDPDFVRACSSPRMRALAAVNPAIAIGLRNFYRHARYDLWGRLPAHLRKARIMLEQADLLLPNSVAEAENLALLMDAPWVRSKTCVIPNGVDPALAPPPGLSLDLPNECILEAAAVHPVKGQLKVIRALAEHPELPLVFVGRPDAGYLEMCRAAARGRPNVWFVGEVPHAHMAAYLARARVHVLPSLRESPGLATLEAALQGARCVVSHHGPTLEYFGPDVWYCDPASTESIRDAIVRAWVAPASTRLRDRILTHFTWPEVGLQTQAAYARLLAAPGATAS
jgi:glycosyltransferase involved in cell wall biosynthesis